METASHSKQNSFDIGFLFIVIVLISMFIGLVTAVFVSYHHDNPPDLSSALNFNNIPEYEISLWKNDDLSDDKFKQCIIKTLIIPVRYSDGLDRWELKDKTNNHFDNEEIVLDGFKKTMVIRLTHPKSHWTGKNYTEVIHQF